MISLSLDLVAVECGTDRPHDGFLRLHAWYCSRYGHVLPPSQCGLGLLASTQIVILISSVSPKLCRLKPGEEDEIEVLVISS